MWPPGIEVVNGTVGNKKYLSGLICSWLTAPKFLGIPK